MQPHMPSSFTTDLRQQLEQLERSTSAALRAVARQGDRPHQPHYRAFIEAAPFFALATRRPTASTARRAAIAPGFVRVHDEKTLIPDRRGNNRIDSLRNILHDPASRCCS